MTDFELNKAIARALYPEAKIHLDKGENCAVFIKNPNGSDLPWIQVKDYCNNWNDLMPLVVEYRLCLSNLYDPTDWAAIKTDEKGYQKIVEINKNPQRALAECLYKVLQAKAEKE